MNQDQFNLASASLFAILVLGSIRVSEFRILLKK